MVKGFIIGFLLAIVLAGAGLNYYFSSGMAPAASGDPPMPFERKLAHMALRAHIEANKVGDSPVAADEHNLGDGADIYRQYCAPCHGLPNQHPSPYEKTMYPKPTALFRGKGVTDDPPAESYWKVANGIRLSGMPSFKSRLTNTQMWQVSELVAHANEIPASVKAKLIPDPPTTTADVTGRQKPQQK